MDFCIIIIIISVLSFIFYKYNISDEWSKFDTNK